MNNRGDLNTEQQNQRSSDIDTKDVKEILHTINREDLLVAQAVKDAIPEIEQAVDHTVTSINLGGRVFYVGAGTSGRLGVLDASEIPPTFSAPQNLFIGLIAGGDKALRQSIEGAEDSAENALLDLEPFQLNANDTLIGISCSGAASYVISALDHAREKGAKTIYLVTNPRPYSMTNVDVVIHADTGPEIVTGSTRMKAGTATKMILNMISTTAMIKMNCTYGNLMVNLKPLNKKLKDRSIAIVSHITGKNRSESKDVLKISNYQIKEAVLMISVGMELIDARAQLERNNGSLRRSLDENR